MKSDLKGLSQFLEHHSKMRWTLAQEWRLVHKEVPLSALLEVPVLVMSTLYVLKNVFKMAVPNVIRFTNNNSFLHISKPILDEDRLARRSAVKIVSKMFDGPKIVWIGYLLDGSSVVKMIEKGKKVRHLVVSALGVSVANVWPLINRLRLRQKMIGEHIGSPLRSTNAQLMFSDSWTDHVQCKKNVCLKCDQSFVQCGLHPAYYTMLRNDEASRRVNKREQSAPDSEYRYHNKLKVEFLTKIQGQPKYYRNLGTEDRFDRFQYQYESVAGKTDYGKVVITEREKGGHTVKLLK